VPASAPNLAGPWAAPVALTAFLLLALLLYGRGWFFLSREMPGRVPAWRLASFLAGLATVWIAWSARIDALTHYLLVAHMVQHLLLALVAPPLLLLGSPVLVFRRGTGRAARRQPGEFARSARVAWAGRLGSWLTHPVFAGSIMVAITIFWHIPAVFQMAMSSGRWHAVENATFLASSVLFWWPVILPWPGTPQWPRWTVPLYLLGADMPVSVLSAYLAFCGHVVYPAYLAVPRPFAISALNDQVAAAMLMWVAMLLVFLAAAVAVILELIEPSWRPGPVAEGAGLPDGASPGPSPWRPAK